ncbi:MAG: TMEM175 family protein, partial [bacterium]
MSPENFQNTNIYDEPLAFPHPAPTTSHLSHPGATLSTTRLLAFCDGVFAIVITLLAFQFDVPKNIPPEKIATQLPLELLKIVPSIGTYMLSFILVGIFWIAHHNIFSYIRRIDRTFLWLNLSLLMGLAFLPFPTKLLGYYMISPHAVRMYCGTLFVTSMNFFLIWWYASGSHRLIDAHLAPDLIRWARQRALAAPIVYAAAFAVTYRTVLGGLFL